MIADRWDLSRSAMDEFALRSHDLAARATTDGTFDSEVAPITGRGGALVTEDEGIRTGGTVEKLAGIRGAYADGGNITAANSSQITDGAAALLMMTTEKAAALGVRPLVRVHTAVVAAADPVMMLTAPIPATAKALATAGLKLTDINVFEVNEAFASIPLAWLAETGADPALLNPCGGAIALGHPIGGSGARLMSTLVHAMVREGHEYGLQTMCEGGGMANATILSRV
jgi:acetyl-CoA acyltransferase